MSSENVGLLCSRSLSQPMLKVPVNVSLDDMLCIAEPFVTKPSMVRHHYKPERHMRKWVSIFKVKVTVTEFRFIQSNMTISLICSELLICWGDQLSMTVHVKRLLCYIQGQGHNESSCYQNMTILLYLQNL